MKVKNVGFRRDREFAEPRASAPICLLHWVGWSRGSDASSFFYVAKFAPEQTFNMQFQNLSKKFTYPKTHTSKVILFGRNFFSSKFLLSTASTTDSDYLQQHPLTSCHIVMKENPKKSPRAPPNSAIKEVNGYKRTSTSVKVLSDIAQKATKVSFSEDISWPGLGKTFGFVNANLYSL